MLPRAYRLRERRAVLITLRRGTVATSRALALHALRTRVAGPRFAVVVSRKTAKRAVDRNRVRRRIRAILLGLAHTLPHGLALVVRVRPPALTQTFVGLTADLQRLLRRFTP